MASDKDFILHEDLKRAIEKNRVNEVDQLMKDNRLSPNKISMGYGTPFEYAVISGKADVVKLMIDNGADVNQRGNGSLNERLSNKSLPIHLVKDNETLKVLLEAGANPNARYTNTDHVKNTTPLHIAAQRGDVEMINTLVKAGANLNKADSVGFTPLHRAANSVKSHEAFEALKSLGADVDARLPHNNKTAADLAKAAIKAAQSEKQTQSPAQDTEQLKAEMKEADRKSQERVNQLNTEHKAQHDINNLNREPPSKPKEGERLATQNADSKVVTSAEPGQLGSVTKHAQGAAQTAPAVEVNSIEPATKTHTQEASPDKSTSAAEAQRNAKEAQTMAEIGADRKAANDTQEKNTGTTNREDEALATRQKNSAALMAQVNSEYHHKGDNYHHRDRRAEVAFKDTGDKVSSASNDAKVAEAMVTLAAAKEWDAIKVKGHPDFKREVWMAASLRGIEVQGYTPTKEEVKQLEEKRANSMQNSVEKDTSRTQSKDAQQTAELSPRAKVAEAVAHALIESKVPQANRQALQEAITNRLTERMQTNTVPQVAMYDKGAAARGHQQERTAPVVERDTDRSR